ncbi:type IV pilus modification protein PilV [Hydrogenophaga sp.]|uniref:type IV pilus modification protein PilV n=1 Tax=Hydrogenophaga sp. TaxID=1904254 RepID=UPI002731556D|nr:type IV pilus modification protein PilV [Hydrogenophaga sp.]MDP2073167.1 type IV pilus modification protein PilV [Hydrogenophaga sp.]MDP3109106.1 type IV pilus modification protein PilV [Hydrogenophaga sp.]
MKTTPQPSANLQCGASLIEVLVALLIISLGLMSMARLSATTIGFNKGAQVRLVALSLATQYAERARLNVYGFDLGDYDIALNGVAPNPPAPDVNANDVTAATNVAQGDRREFTQRLANHLPQGLAVVNSTRAPGVRDLDIWIMWQDVNTEPSGALLAAGESQCPAGVNGNSCLYFKVRL